MTAFTSPAPSAAPYQWDRGRKIAAAVAIAALLFVILGLASQRRAGIDRMREAARRTALLNEIVEERDLAHADRDWLQVENAILRDRLSEFENSNRPAPPP